MQQAELGKLSQASKQRRKQQDAERAQKSNLLPYIVGRNNQHDNLPSLNEGRFDGMRKNVAGHRRNGTDSGAPYLGRKEYSKNELGSGVVHHDTGRNSNSRYSFNGLPMERGAEQSDSKPFIASDNEELERSKTKSKLFYFFAFFAIFL